MQKLLSIERQLFPGSQSAKKDPTTPTRFSRSSLSPFAGGFMLQPNSPTNLGYATNLPCSHPWQPYDPGALHPYSLHPFLPLHPTGLFLPNYLFAISQDPTPRWKPFSEVPLPLTISTVPPFQTISSPPNLSLPKKQCISVFATEVLTNHCSNWLRYQHNFGQRTYQISKISPS